MTKENPYKWTVEIEVDPLWVADGFDLDKDRLLDMLCHELECARPHEYDGRIIKAPDPKQVRAEQGYKEPGYSPVLCEYCEAFNCGCESYGQAVRRLS